MHLLINSVYIFLAIVLALGIIIPTISEFRGSKFNLVKTLRIVGLVSVFYGSVVVLTLGLNAMTQ